MFLKTVFTPEELEQVGYVNEKLDQLRSYASRYDAGEAIDHDELQAFVDDILDNVVPTAERLAMNSHQQEMQDTCVRICYPDDYKNHADINWTASCQSLKLNQKLRPH